MYKFRLRRKQQEEHKLWVDVIRGNRLLKWGTTIDFKAPRLIDPEVEIEITEDDMEYKIKFWKAELIMLTVGKDFTMTVVTQFMAKYGTLFPSLIYTIMTMATS